MKIGNEILDLFEDWRTLKIAVRRPVSPGGSWQVRVILARGEERLYLSGEGPTVDAAEDFLLQEAAKMKVARSL